MPNMNDILGAVIVLAMTVMLLGIALTVIGTLEIQARESTLVQNENITPWANNYTLFVQAPYIDTTATWECDNISNAAALSAAYFIWDKTGKFEGSGVELTDAGANAIANGSIINCSYYYGRAGTPATAIGNSITELDDFVGWIGVIIIAIGGGLVFYLVMKTFRG